MDFRLTGTQFDIGPAIRIARRCLPVLFGLLVLGLGSLGVVRAEAPTLLTDGQLDRATAGKFAFGTADGQALGARGESQAAVSVVFGKGNEANTLATGAVRSAASSPSSSAPATASSSLQLRVVFP